MAQTGDMITLELSKSIQTLLIQLFTTATKVTEGGLIAFHGLVVGLQEKIDIN